MKTVRDINKILRLPFLLPHLLQSKWNYFVHYMQHELMVSNRLSYEFPSSRTTSKKMNISDATRKPFLFLLLGLKNSCYITKIRENQ